MNLKSRIQKLEQQLHNSDVVLSFSDGSRMTIRAPRSGEYLRWVLALIDDPLCPQATLIRRAVRVDEPGGSHLLEFLTCLTDEQILQNLNSPEGLAAAEAAGPFE